MGRKRRRGEKLSLECCILDVWRGPSAGREGAGLGRRDFFRLGFISQPSEAIRECSALQKVISLSLAGTQARAGLAINPVISLMSVNS